MRTTGLYGTGLAIILAVTLGTATKANAQLTLLNATGYGVIGFWAGAGAGALVGGTECHGGGDFICIPPAMVIGSLAGLVTGIVAGRKMALRADRKVRDGEALTGGHRAALAVGSVWGGSMLGFMIGAQVTPEYEGAIIGMVAGAALSIRYLRSRWGSFEGRQLQVRPAIVGGEAWITARIRF